MKLNVINEAAKEVYTLYDRLNQKYFRSELPSIPIYIHPNIKKISCFDPSVMTVFNRRESQQCQISFSDYIYTAPLIEVCEMMLHQMCHYFCFLEGIKDTSNHMTYHNKRFRDVAKKHGLLVAKNKYGFAMTSPTAGLIDFVNMRLADIKWGSVYRYRMNSPEVDEQLNKLSPKHPELFMVDSNSHHRKYVCPRCGNSVRATKAVRIKCADCNLMMRVTGRCVAS